MKTELPATEASVWPESHERVTHLSSAHPHSARYAWYVLFLLWLVNVFNYMDRMALSVLVPSIKADIQLSDGQLGLLTGFAFALFYAICGIPIARWADHGIRRNVITLALGTWSIMTVLCGAAQNFWHLFLARVGVGVGEAGGLAPAQSILCDYAPLKRRSGVLAIHAFGLTAGMMIGMALAGWLGDTIGWRWTFVALGSPGVVLALIVRFTLREPARGLFDAVKDEATRLSFGKTLSALWRLSAYRLIVLYGVVVGLVSFGLLQWWPSLYMRVYGLDLSSVGLYLGIAMGAGGGIGLLAGGLLANRAAERSARMPLIIGAIATSLALPAGLASLFLPSTFGAMFAAFLTELLLNVAGAPIIATMYSIVTSRMRATAGTIAVFFQALIGFGLGPLCVGVLSDSLAPSLGTESLRYALLVPVCFIPAIAAVLYAIARALDQPS